MRQEKKQENIKQLEFNPPNEPGLEIELLSIKELQKRAGVGNERSPTSRANFYRLIGVVTGSTALEVDFQTYQCSEQDWVLVRPGQVIRYDFTNHWTGYLLVFKSESLITRVHQSINKNAPEYDNENMSLQGSIENMPSLITLSKLQHESIRRALKQIEFDSHLQVALPIRNELLRLQITSLLIRLSIWCHDELKTIQPHFTTQTNFKHFKRFRQLLEKDFALHHQVQHYAHQLGMSDKNLNRVCQSASGLSAKHNIARRINLEAKRLLVHTQLPIQAIAIDLGFDETTNFVKFFKRELGISPNAFRFLQIQSNFYSE